MNLRSRWLSTAFCLVLLLGVGQAVADEPRDWLRRMNDALAERNYDGSFFHMSGGKVESLRIIHRVAEGKVAERLVSLDGSGREFIRTGGEVRISNFLLWQLAYTELWFTETLWPDVDAATLQRALDDYANRERRFGLTGDQRADQPETGAALSPDETSA